EDRMAFGAAAGNIGFWRLDTSTGRMWATDHCRSMFGIAPNIALSWELFRNAVQADDRAILDDILRSPETEFKRSREFRIVLPDGEERWYMGRYCVEQRADPGRPQIAGIFVDATKRKNAELEADTQRKELTHMMRVAALGELSGGIAHELSQPLAAILA